MDTYDETLRKNREKLLNYSARYSRKLREVQELDEPSYTSPLIQQLLAFRHRYEFVDVPIPQNIHCAVHWQEVYDEVIHRLRNDVFTFQSMDNNRIMLMGIIFHESDNKNCELCLFLKNG